MKKNRLIVVVMILMCSFVAGIAEECTNHNMEITSQTNYQYVHLEDTTAGHVYVQYEYRMCAECKEQSKTIIARLVKPHRFTVRVESVRHVPGGYHDYIYKCAECEMTAQLRFECEGPCETDMINKKPVSIIVVDQ